LRGVDFRRAVLVALNLKRRQPGARRAIRQSVEDAVLPRTDLRGADLSRAELGSVLEPGSGGAILTSADLRGAKLRGTYFSGAVLSGADLRDEDLSQDRLDDADLGVRTAPARESGARARCSDRFAFAKLAHAHLQEATLRHAQLDGAHLRSAELRGADLRNATLTNARLQGAELLGANLRGADLRRARGVDVAGTRGTPSHLPNERCPRVQPEALGTGINEYVCTRTAVPEAASQTARDARPTGPRSRSSSRHAHAPN
jgi:uncharacterized protein YjbI with pentapeptide repeats